MPYNYNLSVTRHMKFEDEKKSGGEINKWQFIDDLMFSNEN